MDPDDARRASLRTRPPRIAFSTAPHAATRDFRAPRRTAYATTLARIALTGEHFSILLSPRSLDKKIDRGLSYQLARVARRWRKEDLGKMPVAMGDIREIAGQPVFVPLYLSLIHI